MNSKIEICLKCLETNTQVRNTTNNLCTNITKNKNGKGSKNKTYPS